MSSHQALAHVSELLEVKQAEVEKALCHRVIAARGEVMEKGHTVSEAVFGRDALAKVYVFILKLRNHATPFEPGCFRRRSMRDCSRG